MAKHELARFWHLLEAFHRPAAVDAEWRIRLRSGFETARRFLRATDQLSNTYPRLDPTLGLLPGPQFDVWNLAGRYVAVCPLGLARMSLSVADLTIWELDRTILGQRIAQALCINFEGRSLDDHAWLIGLLSPIAGSQYPAVLTFPHEPDDLRRTIERLIASGLGPFAILSPTSDFCDSHCLSLLAAHESVFVPMCSALDIGDSGRFSLTHVGREILSPYLQPPRPVQHTARQVFATPTGATWRDVNLRFVDGETVSVRVNQQTATLNYTQLGMASQRNGRPTKQWQLLRAFAEERGCLTWGSSHADRRNQKQKELLSKSLQQFFCIDGDAFELAGNGWQTCFSIKPDHE